MSRFWLWHGVVPGAALGLFLAVLLAGHLDTPIAQSWAYGSAAGWVGAHTWWAEKLIHAGGRALVWVIGLGALILWMSTFFSARYHHLRSAARYIALGVLLSTGLAGLLKTVSNVDCPWDLQGFGGKQPYVALFEHRDPTLPRARCFPGAHSSSGFALMGFYFLFRDRSRRAARLALAGGILMGAIFSFGQEARGAHFLSHDLTSAVLVWYVLLALYVVLPPVISPRHGER